MKPKLKSKIAGIVASILLFTNTASAKTRVFLGYYPEYKVEGIGDHIAKYYAGIEFEKSLKGVFNMDNKNLDLMLLGDVTTYMFRMDENYLFNPNFVDYSVGIRLNYNDLYFKAYHSCLHELYSEAPQGSSSFRNNSLNGIEVGLEWD